MITVEINDSKGQKYTKKWESMPEFEDWILPDKSNVHRAWCKYCNKSMKAKCSSLKYHANSTVHLKAKTCALDNVLLKNKKHTIQSPPEPKPEMRQKHEMREKIEILTNKLTSNQISHKAEIEKLTNNITSQHIRHRAEIERLQNKLAAQQFDHKAEVEKLQEKNEKQEAETKKLQSELAKQQEENKMLFSTNLSLTNQVKKLEEYHKSKNNNGEIDAEESGYLATALEKNNTNTITDLTTDENEESFVLEAIKEEPAYIEQPGTQRNTEQNSTAPDCKNPRKRKLQASDNDNYQRKELISTRENGHVNIQTADAQFVFKCKTCDMFYKQLRSVIERQDLNGN